MRLCQYFSGMLTIMILVLARPVSADVVAGAAARIGDTCLEFPPFITIPNTGIGASCATDIATVSASASAAFGSLHALARIDEVGLDHPLQLFADGDAQWFDNVTLSAGSQLMLKVEVEGNSGTALLGGHGQYITENGFVIQVPVTSPGREVSLLYDYQAGTPFQIGVTLEASLQSPFCPSPCTQEFLSDFSDTATLSSIEVLDDQGTPLSGVTITSASGYDYSGFLGPGPQPVPEPATGVLLAIGLAGMAVSRSRFLWGAPAARRGIDAKRVGPVQ